MPYIDTASKVVYYQGWNRSPAQVGCMREVLGPGALGGPRGIGWTGRWEGGSGWGTHVTPWLIHVNVWQKPLQYCKVISLQLIKINGKKKEKKNQGHEESLASLNVCSCRSSKILSGKPLAVVFKFEGLEENAFCKNKDGNVNSGCLPSIELQFYFVCLYFLIFLQWISSVQWLRRVCLFVTPWTAARQASLSNTNSQNLLKLMSIESMKPSTHLILCHPLLLLPSIFPSIMVFSNESVLCIRWPKY